VQPFFPQAFFSWNAEKSNIPAVWASGPLVEHSNANTDSVAIYVIYDE